MPAYTLDANTIIYYVGNEEKVVRMMRPLLSREIILYIPTTVIVEIFSTELSESERMAIETIVGTSQIIPLYENIARMAADLRRNYRIKTPDASIAATALATGSTLLSRNIRDFKRIASLSVEEI